MPDVRTIVSALLEDDDKHRFASVVVLRKMDDPEVLIIKRGSPPEEGKWACPGGHAEEDEDLKKAAARELEEETGLKADDLTHLVSTKAKDRPDASVAFYWTVVDDGARARAEDDAEKAKWMKVSELPKLAYNNNEQVEMAVDEASIYETTSSDRRSPAGRL